MTRKQAKKLALEKLLFYKNQPVHHRTIHNLPNHLKAIVTKFHNNCPLCELFCFIPKNGLSCGDCPLTCPACNSFENTQLEKNIKRIQAWDVDEKRSRYMSILKIARTMDGGL